MKLFQNFYLSDGSMGKKVIIFGAYMSSFVHIDNKGKDILILGKGLTQELDEATLTAEAIYPIDFTQPNKRCVWNLQYNGSNSFFFVNATKIYQSKAKNSEIKDYSLSLGNTSKDLQFITWKKENLGLKGVGKKNFLLILILLIIMIF